MRPHASSIERLLVRSLPLALVLGMLGATFGTLVGAPREQVAHADNPSINIVSPTSAQGPVQTGIRVVGAGWNPGDSIQIFYNQLANNMPCGDPANAQALAGSNPIPGVPTQTARPDGTWTIDFQWPSNTGKGQFYICAFDTTTPTQVTPSTQPFGVLSTALPTVTIDNQFPNIGDQIKVTGNGFLPGNQPIDLLLAQPGQQTGTKLATVTAGNDGSFTQQIKLPTSPSGALNLIAVSRTPVKGALPPLYASQTITIGATASTPTPTPPGTVTPSPTATTPASDNITSTTPTSSSKSGLILTLLVVALALVILAIFGVLIWYVAGTRPPAGADAYGAPSPAYNRGMDTPRRAQSGRQSPSAWQSDDEWESQQGPWEEDEQGGWNNLSTQWGNDANPWPQDQGSAGAPPSWSGPAGRGNSGAQRPMPRGPNRDGGQGRARPGQDGW